MISVISRECAGSIFPVLIVLEDFFRNIKVGWVVTGYTCIREHTCINVNQGFEIELGIQSFSLVST